MKKILIVFAVCVLITNLKCSGSSDASNSDLQDREVTQNDLDVKKQEVLDYINGFQCVDSCNFIAFGSKPCGGPWEYIVFPSSVNIDSLQTMVTDYNQMQHEFNMQTGAISDCAMVMPPNQVDCVGGVCTVIN